MSIAVAVGSLIGAIAGYYGGKIDDYLKKLLKSEEEKIYNNSDIKYICGIDEAGRGPLAGPVVVGAVILPKDSFIEGV